MAIGSEGSYILQFDLAGVSDFIAEEDLIGFTLIEEAGNALPTFALTFAVEGDDIFARLYEGNVLTVTMGTTRADSFTAFLRATRVKGVRSGSAKRTIDVVGIYDGMTYAYESHQVASDRKSAVEVMADVVKGTGVFTWDSNVTQSADAQVWLQVAQSDKRFVQDLWLRMDLGESFPAVGIASDGTFILRDVLKDLQDKKKVSGLPYRWRFARQSNNDQVDILINGDPTIDCNSTLMNVWMGHGRSKIAYDLDTGDQGEILLTATPLLALSNQMPAAMGVNRRFGGPVPQNENMHPRYQQSFVHNLTHLAAFGNVRQTVTFDDLFRPVRVLDLVMLKDEEPASGNKSASEFTSGLYYVSKVARHVTARNFSTSVVLCRESLNALRAGP